MKKKINHQIKNISIGFTASKLTNYSGLSGVGKFLKKNKTFKYFNKIFPTVISNATQFSNSQILMLLVLSSFCKINRLQKVETFSKDVLVKQTLNLNKPISDSRISERLKDMGQKVARKIENNLLNENNKFLSTISEDKITIDIDSSVKSVYGNQEGVAKGYNDKKRGSKSYHPLLAFISNYKLVAHTWLRSGDSYTANGVDVFVQQILSKLPKNIKSVFFRMDSGFFDNQLMEMLENLGHEYLIKVKFKNMYQLFKTLHYEKTDNPHYEISELDYPFTVKDENNKDIKVCRLLRVIREIKFKSIGKLGEEIIEYEYFSLCSNLKGKSTMDIYEIYKKRGECENWIEQVKNHLMAGSTLTDNFWANDILWQLSVYAYNLSVKMRIKNKKLFKQEHNTFREWFINVAGILTKQSRKIKLNIYKHYVYKDDWIKFYNEI